MNRNRLRVILIVIPALVAIFVPFTVGVFLIGISVGAFFSALL